MLVSVKNTKGDLPFNNGPVLQEGVNNFKGLKHYTEGKNLVIESVFDKKESYNTLQWVIYPSGWIKLEVNYFPSAYFTNFAGINFSFHLDEELQIDEKRSTAFFRIFQESLTNVIRHANAKNVSISLRKEANNVLLMIVDDGRGIAQNEITNPRSVGLLGMKERAASVNGEVHVLGQSGVGTTVRVRMPISESST